MRHSFTATTTASSVEGSLFLEPGQSAQSITIWNGANPLYFTKYGTADSTNCGTIAANSTFSTIITQAIPSISFITTGGDSVVVIETF